jgi:hypothetical protein
MAIMGWRQNHRVETNYDHETVTQSECGLFRRKEVIPPYDGKGTGIRMVITSNITSRPSLMNE